jgi:hypothetical protein
MLFGYDYEIICKKGKENVVVDALSRKYEDEGSIFYLSFIVPYWLQVVRYEWLQDPKFLSYDPTITGQFSSFPRVLLEQ